MKCKLKQYRELSIPQALPGICKYFISERDYPCTNVSLVSFSAVLVNLKLDYSTFTFQRFKGYFYHALLTFKLFVTWKNQIPKVKYKG